MGRDFEKHTADLLVARKQVLDLDKHSTKSEYIISSIIGEILEQPNEL